MNPKLVALHWYVATALATAAPLLAADPSPTRPPNIVVILADDLGQRDLGSYGSTLHETPHLDRLAATGVRFTAGYAASNVCSPTRASLLTGRHPARIGITDWLPGRAPQPGDAVLAPKLPAHLGPRDRTFADVFRAAGYRTGFVGKWHLGDTLDHFPDRHGFDVNIGGSGKGHPPSYFSPYRLPNLPDGPAGEHLDERLTREAVSFVRTATSEAKPFLLVLSAYAVHTPLQAPEDLVAKYRTKLAQQPPAGPEFTTDGPDGRVRIRQTHPVYAAMVESLDRSVGALLASLEELGQADNTLVIFTSDNGGLSTAEGWPTSNLPLRAGKGWAYEGGVRVPLLVAWPGRIPGGRTSDAMVTSPDIFPTLLEFAGLPAQPDLHVDGHSFASVLRDSAAVLPSRPAYWHYPHYSNQRGRPHSAIRSGNWKLIEWLEDGRVELYDLARDPGEATDLAATEGARAAALRTELHAWRQSVGARLPTPRETPPKATANPAVRAPNLVVIMTDDQGYADVGFHGSKDIPTPHLDSIAAAGVRFTNGYVSYAVCSPSRAGLLTGRYPQRFGHERNPAWQPTNPQSGLPVSETLLPAVLGRVGYVSGLVGKWHLGAHPQFHPLARGFNEFFGHLGGGHRYFPDELTIKETEEARDEAESYRLWIRRDHTPVRTTQYLTDEFSDEAVRFVERHQKTPFFLYLAYNAPHAPLQATEKYLARFPHIADPKRRTYAAMVSAVDDGVGRVLAKLRELKLEENTLVVFLSDNGGPTPDNASDNRPLRGHKGSPWEGGIRVPFAAQWPGQIPRGLVYEQPVIALDIFATIAALAQAPLDPARPLDGVNLMPYLRGTRKGAPHEAIYLRMFDRGVFAVRSGDSKLVIPTRDAAPQLFDLSRDLAEGRNIAGDQPEELARLETLRAAWNAQLVPPVFEGLMSAERGQKKGRR